MSSFPDFATKNGTRTPENGTKNPKYLLLHLPTAPTQTTRQPQKSIEADCLLLLASLCNLNSSSALSSSQIYFSFVSKMSFWGPTYHNTVLITGGASGIGLALATRLLAAGHKVIVAGRRADVLESAKSQGLLTVQGDVSTDEGRIALATKVIADYPDVNVLINNAGIQNRLAPLTDPAHGGQLWEQHKAEIGINLLAPMHLSFLFIPHFQTKPRAQIVNVTSGLSFAPASWMATYCATKAAAHSFTQSLRYQLKDTPISVVEIIPPAVQTDLGGAGKHTFGEPLNEYSDAVVAKMIESDDNIGTYVKVSIICGGFDCWLLMEQKSPTSSAKMPGPLPFKDEEKFSSF
jgi:uncharacterized oxidoreductase